MMSNKCLKCNESGKLQGIVQNLEFLWLSKNVIQTEVDYSRHNNVTTTYSDGSSKLTKEDVYKENVNYTLYFKKNDDLHIHLCDSCAKKTLFKFNIYLVISILITAAILAYIAMYFVENSGNGFSIFDFLEMRGGATFFFLLSGIAVVYFQDMSSKKRLNKNFVNSFIEKKEDWCDYSDIKLMEDRSFGKGSKFYIGEEDFKNFTLFNDSEGDSYYCNVKFKHSHYFEPK
jgi:hypothetical protein